MLLQLDGDTKYTPLKDIIDNTDYLEQEVVRFLDSNGYKDNVIKLIQSEDDTAQINHSITVDSQSQKEMIRIIFMLDIKN